MNITNEDRQDIMHQIGRVIRQSHDRAIRNARTVCAPKRLSEIKGRAIHLAWEEGIK